MSDFINKEIKEGNPETPEHENTDPNILWEELNDHLGGADRIIHSAVRRNLYSLDLTDTVDGDDLEQEASIAIFQAWIEKKTNHPRWQKYISNLKKSQEVLDEDKPAIFGGYAKKRMHWQIIQSINLLAGKTEGQRKSNLGTTKIMDMFSNRGEEEDGYDVFERLMIDSDAQNPQIDSLTRERFESFFGIQIHNQVEAAKLREILYKTAYNVMEKKQQEIIASGSRGAYRKGLPSAVENRYAAFWALYIYPITHPSNQEIDLKSVAKKNNLNYEALVKEARRIPQHLFLAQKEITQEVAKELQRYQDSIKPQG